MEHRRHRQLDSLILLRRVSGQVKAVGHCSIGYPGNQGSTYQNFRVLPDRVELDLKDVHVQCTGGMPDLPDLTAHAKPLTLTEIMEAKVPVPKKSQPRSESDDVDMVQLNHGVYKKGAASLQVTRVENLKLKDEQAAFAVSRVSYGDAGVSLLIVYRFRRMGGRSLARPPDQ